MLGPWLGRVMSLATQPGTPADLVAARSTLTGEHLADYVGVTEAREALAP